MAGFSGNFCIAIVSAVVSAETFETFNTILYCNIKRMEMNTKWKKWRANGLDIRVANSKCVESILGFLLWISDHFQDGEDAQHNLAQVGGLKDPQS